MHFVRDRGCGWLQWPSWFFSVFCYITLQGPSIEGGMPCLVPWWWDQLNDLLCPIGSHLIQFTLKFENILILFFLLSWNFASDRTYSWAKLRKRERDMKCTGVNPVTLTETILDHQTLSLPRWEESLNQSLPFGHRRNKWLLFSGTKSWLALLRMNC